MAARTGGRQLSLKFPGQDGSLSGFPGKTDILPESHIGNIRMEEDLPDSGSSADRPGVWTERERDAWAPPDELLVSAWAEQHRMLPARQSAAPGPWQNIPFYTVEVMDTFIDPWVENITIMASVQSSKTESVYNMIGYAICQDPAPVLVTMPTLATLRRVNKRLEAMIKESPEMARHLTGDPDDLTRQEIRLDNMTLYFATAGSTADLRNVEARYIILDETDDYPLGVSDQGSPIEMAEARSTTYWNRKIVHVCTPTTDVGYIAIEYERSDKSRYWVSCPYCSKYQVLSFWRVKHRGAKLGQWPKDLRDADYIRLNRVARYECIHCAAEIDDRDKRWMLRFGTWVPDGHPIDEDGSVEIPRPRSTHRGFWWNALYSPWRSFSDVAAQFFRSKDDPEKYKTFVNLWLAEPWKEVTRQRETAEILALRTERPSLLCPAGTLAITAGIDNQKHGRWVVLRAWVRASDESIESHLVRYGYLETWEELERWLFADVYSVEGNPDLRLQVWRAGIDIGGGDLGEDADETMTEQVYEWLRLHGQGVAFGVKGSSRGLNAGRKLQSSLIDKMPGRSGRIIPGGIKLWLVDTGRIKDALWSRIETGKFHLPSDAGEDYARQITAEAKQRNPRTGRFSWVVQGSRANHLFDAEVYAAAMADPECDGGVMVLRPPGGSPPRSSPAHGADHHPPSGAGEVIRSTRQQLRGRTINPYARAR